MAVLSRSTSAYDIMRTWTGMETRPLSLAVFFRDPWQLRNFICCTYYFILHWNCSATFEITFIQLFQLDGMCHFMLSLYGVLMVLVIGGQMLFGQILRVGL